MSRAEFLRKGSDGSTQVGRATRTQLGKHLSESKPFNIGVIFASFALLVAAFWGPPIARKMTQGAREMIKGKPQVPNDADTLAMLREHASIAGAFHEQITDMTSAFRDNEGIITRGANAKKSDMLAAFEDVQTTFSSAAGDRPPKLPNKDLVPKTIGSIAAAGIDTAAIMTFLGEDIAVADMAADIARPNAHSVVPE